MPHVLLLSADQVCRSHLLVKVALQCIASCAALAAPGAATSVGGGVRWGVWCLVGGVLHQEHPPACSALWLSSSASEANTAGPDAQKSSLQKQTLC